MSRAPHPQSPTKVPDLVDTGDETQRNFRYQHGYGVILLIGSLAQKLPYSSIWCEQHEDYLAELPSGEYDAYQIKTGTPENGPWVWSSDPLRSSIRRFVRLEQQFPNKISKFNFVSNVSALDSNATTQIARSPYRLLEALDGTLTPTLSSALSELVSYCGCDETVVRRVLKRLELKRGPGRDSFEDEIAQSHLPTLGPCKRMSPAQIARCLDELIALVFRASSLINNDPMRHYCALLGEQVNEAALRAKKISVQAISELLSNQEPCPFKYAQTMHLPQLGKATERTTLYRKLVHGGLSEFFGTMKSRAISTERHLIEHALTTPEEIDSVLNQLCEVVKGECAEARLSASQGGGVYGPAMLVDVNQRLRQLARERPELVLREPYEVLSGISGILTEECHIWWSEHFDVNGES